MRRAHAALVTIDRRLWGVPSLLKRTLDCYNAHDGPFVSAAMAYYFFFSLFPVALALIAISSLFIQTATVRAAVMNLITYLAPGLADIVERNLELVLQQRGTIGVIAILGLIYSASGLFGVLLAVANRAWGSVARRSTLAHRALAVALVLVMALLFIAATFLTTGSEFLRRVSPGAAGEGPGTPLAILQLLLSIALTAGGFLILYWQLPATRVHIADAWPAALATGVAWEIARRLYSYYLARFASYSLVYGSLATVIGLMAWFNLTAYIILLGTELSVQIAIRRGRGPGSQ
jgi:membrane protein